MTSGEKRPEDTEETQAGATPDPAPETGAGASAESATDESADAAGSSNGDEAQRAPEVEIATAASAAAAAAAAPAEAEKPKRSFAGRLLGLLVTLLIGGGAALYFAPQIAPHLPASVAAFLAPATQAEGDAATAALIEEAQDAAESAAAQADAATLAAQAVGGRLGELEETVAGLVAGGAGGVDPAVEGRIAELESAVADLRGVLSAAAGGEGADPASMAALRGEFAATIAALQAQGETVTAMQDALQAQQAEIDALQGEINALSASGGPDMTELASQIAALQQAREEDMAAQADLATAADMARRAATLSAALSEIDRAMTFGEPFSGPLSAAANATDVEPPEALRSAAQNGAPTRESLKAGFPDAAYAAIQASLEQEAAQESDGVFSGVVARLQARVTGLPNEPIAGDSVPAKLSRARAALLAGDIDAAVATIQALPEAAQAAMSDWSQGAILRSDADVALREWRAAIKLDVVGQ